MDRQGSHNGNQKPFSMRSNGNKTRKKLNPFQQSSNTPHDQMDKKNKFSNQQRNYGNNNWKQYTNYNWNDKLYFTFDCLNNLTKKNSDHVLITLTQKSDEFEKLLQNVTDSNLLVLTLKILTKVCQANFNETITSILSQACSKNFLKNLEFYIMKLPFESDKEKIKNKLYHDDINQFWTDLIDFFMTVIKLIPTKARDELMSILERINSIFETISAKQNYKIDETVKTAVSKILKHLEDEIEKVKESNKKPKVNSEKLNFEDDPPEDFRKLSVVPTVEDLSNKKPFIRACKIKDAYNNIEHYLDVQFRLLREDFMSPLRNGIQEYLHNGLQKYRSNELRIYKKVTLIAPEVIKDNLGIKIYFGKMKNINWFYSKRFMQGGLLLLSNNNFNTILFAIVSNRNENDLAKGYVLIELCDGTKITPSMYDTQFVMMESKIYFEPYLSVLSAMQKMDARNFPMENYLIHANTKTELPQYIKSILYIRELLMSTKTSDVNYKLDGLTLPINSDEPWPTAKELKLDESQYMAFKSALTEELALIQGPPGTGKTFIALKIVQTLLENKKYWHNYGPIVVVCLTNHALDQFLEGILNYTQSIVRVGSRSKSEKLKPHTLFERRCGKYSDESRSARDIMYRRKKDLEDILNSIEEACYMIKILTIQEAIVPLNILKKYCHDPKLNEFKSNKDLVSWLIGIHNDLILEKPISDSNLYLPTSSSENYDEQIMDHHIKLNLKKCSNTFKIIFPLDSIDAIIQNIKYDISNSKNSKNLIYQMNQELYHFNRQRSYFQNMLAQHPILNESGEPVTNYRWRSYWKWVKNCYDKEIYNFTKMEAIYRETKLKLNEAREMVDLYTLKKHEVVGFTTSGAAKLQSTVRALHAPIVLVEEAAEILEAHVVCSMTERTQHVILIGDHKQLRPKASVYKLGTKFNLNVSLFERMVNIKGDCVQLINQHRMRPQIAKLICPSIYEKLQNDISVFDYPNIKGLEKNLFFINRSNRETNHDYDDSWINQHEVVFLVELAKYLIKQGYEATEITILCTYTGQLFALMKQTSSYAILKEVRVTTVDNFQGEENRIILLSLVRNNGEGNVGFLKEANRVCVALSRAREGLYIMGNMDDLIGNNSIWPEIKKVLEKENAIGDSLELRCQIHADQFIQVTNASDFAKSPEGGCLQKCNSDLSCGHICTSTCHILDREHKEFSCKQMCAKSCPNEHPCPLECYKICQPCEVLVERQLKCGHTAQMRCSDNEDTVMCNVEIEDTLPDCKHTIKKPCGRAINECECSYPCENRLPCGHQCEQNCHINNDPEHVKYQCKKDCPNKNLNCTNDHPCKKRCYETCEPCSVHTTKVRSCGHYFKNQPCSVNIEEEQCLRPCKRKIEKCGHKCPLLCKDVCGNCPIKVKKISSCGHEINVKCCEEATPSKCYKKCQKTLSCGHPCSNKCMEPCVIACKMMVPKDESGLCGHTFSVPCYLKETDSLSKSLVEYCRKPCGTELACGHICEGNCGTCKQGRIHVPCAKPCPVILVCGHKCEVPCRKQCLPCRKPCELRCPHTKCANVCGMVCTPCKEPCTRKCEHVKCSKLCSQLCDVEPCNEPCNINLKCGHPCVGYCGDPCPPLCRICDNEELTELLFGNEGEEDARFIFLEDCNHCIESKGLSQWLMESSDSIGMKTCPKCKTKIMKCTRMIDIIKQCLKDVQAVKKQVFFKNRNDLGNLQNLHSLTLQNMICNNSIVLESHPLLFSFLKYILNQIIPRKNKKKQILSAEEIEVLDILVNVLLSQIFNALALIKKDIIYSYKFVKNQIIFLVELFPKSWQLSQQEFNDIQFELQRLQYMAEMCRVDSENIDCGVIDKEKDYNELWCKLTGIDRFTEELETEVRNKLTVLQKKVIAVQERKIIVKAMGLELGHWFKCPNGHYYVIDDCGGAMVRRKCIECDSEIGGESHRLIATNKLASEMDGATRPAWPQ